MMRIAIRYISGFANRLLGHEAQMPAKKAVFIERTKEN